MTLHYKGAYNLDPNSLPHGEHQPNAVPFREAKDTKALSWICNGMAAVLIVLLAIPIWYRCREHLSMVSLWLGCIGPLLLMFPHELLHAVCFRKDVYLYTNWKQGMLFVIGPETMSKGRFILMSLLPNVLFGWIPYGIGILFPQWAFLAVLGALSAGAGAGDYYNVFHTLTQMPRGARTYLYGFHSYWYMPNES